MPRRAEITIKYTVDLDSVLGWGYEPQDWINLATADVMRQRHYNTSFEVKSVEVLKPQYEAPISGDESP